MYCIEVDHLVKQFGEVKAVDNISFKVEQGELFGFLGINGAGKSTTINMLCTLLEKTSGEVHIGGLSLGREDKRIRHKIGVVFQGNTLDERLTIHQNLYTRAYLYENNTQKVKASINKVCDIFDIGKLLNKSFKELSGGQRRRCEIARALLNEPDILFLDEPTTGLDPHTRKVVWELIEDLQKTRGMTVFLTTHYMEEAVRAHHIAVMDAGKIVAFDTPQRFKEKYASDQLKLVPNNKTEILNYLKAGDFAFEEEGGRINVELSSSLSAIEALQDLKQFITSFEMVQGTMEDAFLNITGKCLREA